MSPYPNAKPLHRDSKSPCGWRAPRLRIRQMNNATQSLDSKRIKGLLLSRHTTEFPAFLGFLICVRENAPPSHSKRTQAIPAGVRGDAARSMISGRYASELKRLSAVIQWISRVFLRVRFYIFEGRKSSGRKAVRQTPRRIHSGRQSRPHFLAF